LSLSAQSPTTSEQNASGQLENENKFANVSF